MVASFPVLLLAVLAGHATAKNSTSKVDIVNLEKNVTATSGSGAVSAAGNLQPFGKMGAGCGINWAQNASFGGGLQAGAPSFGLGGGFTITEKEMSIGLGMGVGAIGVNSSVQLNMGVNGTMRLVLTSTANVTCSQVNQDGQSVTICTSG